MLNQEKLPYKGGILADEMGMGKTLQVGWVTFCCGPKRASTTSLMLR